MWELINETENNNDRSSVFQGKQAHGFFLLGLCK